ncbi:hypothetical protein GOL81_30720 [Sinorhizobium medicae]|nr:hypothetical protein [Sinorhizobium medicae]MDX0580513.1 hypothetical protein [Sinorhizobium medicae]MDX0784186.1 hypothetical protein [Sinorhizobium medicae]MDX1103643.1 hypothetical protein [Sinorhizobium medicae]
MGWRADVVAGVVKHQVLEMDEFAVDPQRRRGIGEMGSFDPALPDRRTAMRSSRRAKVVLAAPPRERHPARIFTNN